MAVVRYPIDVVELVNAAGVTVLVLDGPNKKCIVPTGTTLTLADAILEPADTTGLQTAVNGLRTYLADGMLAIGTITVSGGDATKFKTTTTAIYTIAGAAYSKAATDTLAFTTAGTINTAGAAGTAHWGAWLVQISSAGTITTKAVGGGTTDQDYATEALAIAALPAVTAANCAIGYITVQGLASVAWAATTSNLTVGGGAGNCTARTFYDLPAAKSLPAVL